MSLVTAHTTAPRMHGASSNTGRQVGGTHLVLGNDVHHRAPARQAVAVLPRQQRLAHGLEELLGALASAGWPG